MVTSSSKLRFFPVILDDDDDDGEENDDGDNQDVVAVVAGLSTAVRGVSAVSKSDCRRCCSRSFLIHASVRDRIGSLSSLTQTENGTRRSIRKMMCNVRRCISYVTDEREKVNICLTHRKNDRRHSLQQKAHMKRRYVRYV